MSSIIDSVNESHNINEMLNRAIATLVDLYTAKPHFIYELLQNAEDAEATRIVFIEKGDSLQVLHDGRPFTKRNLMGLTDIGLSDKLPETNKIGKFGVGFKSVFTICKDLYVASEPSHWKGDIKDIYPQFSAWVTDYIYLNEAERVEIPEDFTTFFQFDYFVNEKRYDGFTSISEIQETIAKKLMDIGNTTLLFLKNIQTIEYRIEYDNVCKAGSYTLSKTKLSPSLTDVITTGTIDDKPTLAHYLKFTRPIKIDNVERSVDIAFKVEADEKDNTLKFVKPDNGNVSVYFPTGTVSGLNFIVQGPFRTTPNRSEVLRNSSDNEKLVAQVAFLLRQAIVELKARNLVTAEFLNMLPFDARVFKHLPLFSSLVNSIKQIFQTEAIFPGNDGGYWSKDQIYLSRNNEMTELLSGDLMTALVADGRKHVWVSSKIKQFREFDTLFRFLSSEIGVKVMEPIDLRQFFTERNTFLSQRENEWLIALYRLYSDLPACFEEKKAKSNMLSACFVKTADGRFVAPRRLDGDTWVTNIYRPSTSKKGAQAGNVVDPDIYSKCRDFFCDTLRLPVPTDCDVFLSDFAVRYQKETGISDDEHIADIKKLLKYLDDATKQDEVNEIISSVLKLHGSRGETSVFKNPTVAEYQLRRDADGHDLTAYFEGLMPVAYFVDQDFYAKHGIDAKSLVRLGVASGVVVGADKTIGENHQNGQSVRWQSLGKFRKDLMLTRLPEVLNRIQVRPDEAASREKSRIIYSSLVRYADSLRGKTRAPDGTVSELTNSKVLNIILNDKSVSFAFPREWNGAWLYNKEGILCAPADIKLRDLDDDLYGKLSSGESLVDLLGFQKTKEEEVEEEVRHISPKAKDVIFEQELKRRQSNPESLRQLFDVLNANALTGFEMPKGDDDEFPVRPVGNIERLTHHLLEMLAFADPVTFKHVLRSIRTTAIGPRSRAYLKDLYGHSSGKVSCQLCQKSAPAFEAIEIFPDPKLELEPMHLCLCRNCASKYREFRLDEKMMEKVREMIEELPISDLYMASPVELKLPRKKLWFTPLHLAEVKLLIDLQK